MGQLFRRFWLPALLADELPECDGPPVRLRILGEDLVAFRDSAGKVGIVDPRCPHRGADLFFGRNEAGGIRCVFHGWKFSRDGDCMEAPTFPTERYAQILPKIRLQSYPARESAGMVWVYLGDPAREPAFPMMEITLVPPEKRYVAKRLQECNWAQCIEGSVDTAHFSFLHAPVGDSEAKAREVVQTLTKGYSAASLNYDRVRWMRNDGRPVFHIREHPGGLVLGTSRKADGDDFYWRVTQYLLPTHIYAPSTVAGETYHGITYVPIDDKNCWVFSYSWNPERPLSGDERASFHGGAALHSEVDSNFMPVRNRRNDYLIDRDVQKHESFTGIHGIANQDACIQESQGRIFDRTMEFLGPTDSGVVHWRRLMFQLIGRLESGQDLDATSHPESYCVRSGGHVAHSSKPLEQVMLERFGHPLGRCDADWGLQADAQVRS